MREIKFRAWDGREMFNVDVLAISSCGWDCPDYGRRGVSLAYQKHIKVGQYTGLKDKNGTEIYEGDVLKDIRNKKYIVTWNNDIGSWTNKPVEDNSISYPCFNVGTIKGLEIIGNIYEDSELLEAGG